MNFKKSSLQKLAEMICGNGPIFAHFPYRSSSYLTKFFVELDLDFIHDGSTRSAWVEGVLLELDSRAKPSSQLPADELVKVIESLVDPDRFLFEEKLDIDRARKDLSKVLEQNNLKLQVQKNGQARLVSSATTFVSNDPESIRNSSRVITFTPAVFQIPQKEVNLKLIAVMMPFSAAFSGTFSAVKRVADYMNLECLKADDIWENSTFIQDIFDLIYTARFVVVDFTGRNPNVMYETGIAHTLGKTVIPISQSIDDVPSDLKHHRALKYLGNEEGLRDLSNELYRRIKTLLK